VKSLRAHPILIKGNGGAAFSERLTASPRRTPPTITAFMARKRRPTFTHAAFQRGRDVLLHRQFAGGVAHTVFSTEFFDINRNLFHPVLHNTGASARFNALKLVRSSSPRFRARLASVDANARPPYGIAFVTGTLTVIRARAGWKADIPAWVDRVDVTGPGWVCALARFL